MKYCPYPVYGVLTIFAYINLLRDRCLALTNIYQKVCALVFFTKALQTHSLSVFFSSFFAPDKRSAHFSLCVCSHTISDSYMHLQISKKNKYRHHFIHAHCICFIFSVFYFSEPMETLRHFVYVDFKRSGQITQFTEWKKHKELGKVTFCLY